MENIKIYSLSKVALNIYRKEAKNFKNLSQYILERKLTAMILTAKDKEKDIFDNYIYNFAGFNLVVNKYTHTIVYLYWTNANHKPIDCTEQFIDELKRNYNLLGLSENGNNILT